MLGHKLSRFDKAAIRTKVAGQDIKSYWQKKNGIDDDSWNDINWQAFQSAQKEQPMGKKRWSAKFATSHCGTGRMMHRRKEWTHNHCPVCGQPDEDTHHVLQCPEASHKWNQGMAALAETMATSNTDPLVIKGILQVLDSWRKQEEPDPWDARTSPRLRRALEAQLKLGGWNTMMGRMSKQLTEWQANHLKQSKSRKTGHRWTVAIIKKLQEVAWDMWEHRNGVLHENPDKHHRKHDLEEADAAIEKEWERGPRGLLSGDRFLFRNKKTVQEGALEQKWAWLTSVTLARKVAQEDAANKGSYSRERRGMRAWLNGTRTRETDGSETTENDSRKRQKTNN